jgi:hypothetical protein
MYVYVLHVVRPFYLYVVYLTTLSVAQISYIASNDRMINTVAGCREVLRRRDVGIVTQQRKLSSMVTRA